MGLYPLDLVATTALAWASIFYNRLPTRFYHHAFFIRPVGIAGCVWWVIALIVPLSVAHFFLAFGAVTLRAAWLLHRDHLLRGRMWLAAASALGGSLGVVLILAETFEVYPSNLSGQVQFLSELYLGSAPIGLALALLLFTRRGATEAQLPMGLAQFHARLLLILILSRAAMRIFSQHVYLVTPRHVGLANPLGWTNGMVTLVILPLLAWIALRRIGSSAPSRSGPVLLAMVVLGLSSELGFALNAGK